MRKKPSNALGRMLALALLTIAAPALTWAAEETRELDSFSKIHFTLPFEVEFVQADRHYVTLEGDSDTLDDIETRVKGNTLRIYKDNSWFDWSNASVDVIIGYTELEAINMAGSGDGFAQRIDAAELELKLTGSANLEVDTINADEVVISIAGSGSIELHEVDADSVRSKIAGSGDVEIEGRVNAQEISISGSGDHVARDLRTQETSASIRGSGDVEVWAEARLTASIVGSGDIRYYGNPDVTERRVGSGDVVNVGDEP